MRRVFKPRTGDGMAVAPVSSQVEANDRARSADAD
jgi:hypothetical protein